MILVEWICIVDAEKALKDNKTYVTWQEGFLSVFELMKVDERFINNIYHNVSLEILITYLYKLVYPLIYNVDAEKAKGLLVKEEDKVFIANFYKSAFEALVIEWIKKGMKEEPKDIIKHLSVLIEGTIDHSLRNLNK